MKILITILSLVLLSGCGETTPMEKAKQDQACQDKGGVYSYAKWAGVECRNGGVVINWSELILREEFYPEKGE